MLAYFDCFSGISGDMTLGALVDLGVPVEWLKDQLGRLPLQNFDVTMTSVSRNGIHAKLVHVAAVDDNRSRNFSQIRTLIENSPLTDRVKSTSLQIFLKLAEAEARIHGCSLEEVHFH
jgi:pyridinium-3,5-bisthiocarboxylic acid mononucleotide nickel chelatase